MLLSSELDDMAAAMGDAYNLQASINQKQGNGTWATILFGVPCMIIPANMVDRQKGMEFYSDPIDATMRCAFNALILPGMQAVVTQVQGQAVTAGEITTYEVLDRDDMLSFGREMELRLTRLVTV
jgi:hypothetical protein